MQNKSHCFTTNRNSSIILYKFITDLCGIDDIPRSILGDSPHSNCISSVVANQIEHFISKHDKEINQRSTTFIVSLCWVLTHL